MHQSTRADCTGKIPDQPVTWLMTGSSVLCWLSAGFSITMTTSITTSYTSRFKGGKFKIRTTQLHCDLYMSFACFLKLRRLEFVSAMSCLWFKTSAWFTLCLTFHSWFLPTKLKSLKYSVYSAEISHTLIYKHIVYRDTLAGKVHCAEMKVAATERDIDVDLIKASIPFSQQD